MKQFRTMKILMFFCLQAFAYLHDEHEDLKNSEAKAVKQILTDFISNHDLDEVGLISIKLLF